MADESGHLSAIGVRDLCAFVLRHGDLGRGWPGPAEPGEIGAVHASALEKRREGGGCRVEVPLAREAGGITVRGRADVLPDTPEGPSVEEIKSTGLSPSEIRELAQPDPSALLGLKHAARGHRGGRTLDWAQALCYAAMLPRDGKRSAVDVSIRYVTEGAAEDLVLRRPYGVDELETYFLALAGRYGIWLTRARAWAARRDASLEGAVIPYDQPRPGQREMMEAVEAAITAGERLFVRAPTGVGKTMAVLLPALRSLRTPDVDRVFYLTPRGTAAAAVRDAVTRLREAGLVLRTIHLAARERTCPVEGSPCDPGACRYAIGHHDRILDALAEILECDTIDVTALREVATRHRVCPHELGLDASEWCDLIVGDYNYVFDPRVAIRRYQDPALPPGRQVYLVDEAHQLVDRAREMHSATLTEAGLEALARAVEGGRPALAQAARALAACFAAAAEACEAMRGREGVGWSWTLPDAVPAPLAAAVEEARAWLADWGAAAPPAEAAAVAFDLLFFDAVRRRGTTGYAVIMREAADGLTLELACLDPSQRLGESLAHARASIFFSATLTPPEHYARVLAGGASRDGMATLTLASPFPRENLRVVVDRSLTNRFRERPASAPKVARLVARVVASHPGPYLVFLPSHEYLGRVVAAFERLRLDIPRVAQTPSMTEAERTGLLAAFRRGGSAVGFVVMGGLFAESIDLPGEELVGAVIAGTGLPPPTPLAELIRAYHEENDGTGFERAYLYPGLSRVLQAAGRVIRGPADRGVIVLADARFADMPYREHLPPEWEPLVVEDGPRELVAQLEEFWGEETRG